MASPRLLWVCSLSCLWGSVLLFHTRSFVISNTSSMNMIAVSARLFRACTGHATENLLLFAFASPLVVANTSKDASSFGRPNAFNFGGPRVVCTEALTHCFRHPSKLKHGLGQTRWRIVFFHIISLRARLGKASTYPRPLFSCHGYFKACRQTGYSAALSFHRRYPN